MICHRPERKISLSLLDLCDDAAENSLFVSVLMEFLTIDDIGRCEMVCRVLNHQARHCWKQFDKMMISKKIPSRISSNPDKTARERVIQYYVASTLAEQIGKNMEDRHGDQTVEVIHDETNGDVCAAHCDVLNQQLDFRELEETLMSRYDLYVRFSTRSDNTLLAEGFIPFPLTNFFDTIVEIALNDDNFDLSNWSECMEMNRLVVPKGEEIHNYYALLERLLGDIRATIVGIPKEGCSNVNLIIIHSLYKDTNALTAATFDIMNCKLNMNVLLDLRKTNVVDLTVNNFGSNMIVSDKQNKS